MDGYKYETQWSSPNYTPESQVYATWGVPRSYKAIAIHWWGDPNQGPTYEGIVSYLCRPGGNSSAHLIATGTGRRVAQIVNFNDATWATNSANPYTISIECDPRCRDEDYDVVAELIAQIRSAFGDLPLVPHRQFIATACPGNYDLGRLDRIARTKDGSGDWGVRNRPAPTPAPVPISETTRENYDTVKQATFNKDSRLYDIMVYKAVGSEVYPKGSKVDVAQRLVLSNGNVWYRTKYSADREISRGFRAEDLTFSTGAPINPTPTPPVPPETVPNPSEPPKPQVPPSSGGSDGGFTAADRTMLQDLLKLVTWLVDKIKSIYK